MKKILKYLYMWMFFTGCGGNGQIVSLQDYHFAEVPFIGKIEMYDLNLAVSTNNSRRLFVVNGIEAYSNIKIIQLSSSEYQMFVFRSEDSRLEGSWNLTLKPDLDMVHMYRPFQTRLP